MELTIGILKKVIANLDDSIILAELGRSNDDFNPFQSLKRLIIVKDESENKNWEGNTYLAINEMGSHFTGRGKQEGLKYQGMEFNKHNIKDL